MIKQTIRLAKINYHKTCFQNHKHNLKNTWQTIKCILSKSNTIAKFPDKLIVENNILTNQQKIANHFNEYFTNIGLSLVYTIQLRGLRSYIRYLKNKLNHTFEFHSANDSDVLKIISSLNSKNSSRCDGIFTNLLKLIKEEVTKPITLIINQCLKRVFFPNI